MPIKIEGTKLPHIDVEDFFRAGAQPAAVGMAQAKIWLDGLRSGVLPGYKTGISGLDTFMRLLPSTYTSIGARAGVGKTSLAMQIAENVELQRRETGDKKITVIFSAEMDSRTLVSRMAAKNTGVSLFKLQMGQASQGELDLLTEELSRLAERVTFWIDETSAPTIEHMIAQLAMLSNEYEIGMVLFDYVELAGERERNESLRVASINRGLKRIAKKFDCPVIGLSQLSRDIDRRADKEPKTSDIMQGGEREPDAIVLLVEDEKVESTHDDFKPVIAHIVKNRNGPKGKAPLLFSGSSMKFHTEEIKKTEIY